LAAKIKQLRWGKTTNDNSADQWSSVLPNLRPTSYRPTFKGDALVKKTLVVLAFVLLAGIANAQTVNFSGFSPQDVPFTTLSTGGLTFTNPGNTADYMYVWDTSSPNSAGNPGLIYASYYYGDPVTITATGGGTFNLVDIIATLSWYDGNPSDNITLTGAVSGGGSISDTLSLGQGLQTYNLPGFSNLTSVIISPVASNNGYWLITSVSLPEGGASLLYLLLAGATTFGAIFFRPRNSFTSRAQA
jgi:hypothetical protein